MLLKKQLILHYMSLIGAAASIVQIFVFTFYVCQPIWAFLCGVCGLMFFLVYLFNKQQKHNLARAFYFTFTSVFILIFGLLMGRGNGFHFYYIPFVCVVFVLYDYPEEKKSMIIISTYILLCVVFLFVLEGKWNFISIPQSFQKSIYLSNYATALVITVLAVYNIVAVNAMMEKSLSHSQSNLQAVFDSSTEALFLTDINSHEILSFNERAQLLFQTRTEDELKGKKSSDFFKKEMDINEKHTLETTLKNYGVWRGELDLITNKGKAFIAEVVIKRINMSSILYDLVRVSDITNKLKERDNMIAFLEMKKKDLLNQQKQKNLSLIIHGQEQERQRFSKELHDGIGQILTAVRLQVSALEIDGVEKFQNQKEKIKRIIDTSISEVKRISQDLMPSAIEDFGLIEALEHLCHSVSLPNLPVQFYYDQQLQKNTFTKNEQIVIYRIAQEAINNALKYSQASKITVQFITEPHSEILLNIQDNGKGFTVDSSLPPHLMYTQSNGMSNLKERADLIDARLSITSSIGEGTSINLFIPVKQESV